MTESPFQETEIDTAAALAGEVALVLDKPVAVVLLDLLARIMDEGGAEQLRDVLEHPADMSAVWTLKTALGSAVGVPMAQDYDALVDEARTLVVSRLEAAD
ncbi:hypothetical protein J5J86_05800 [Aquabacter sp. L1I39]|uniref:hypothetical protein n=1 Tax=Aquabacter sp. L1I39 TaxID=2820278 RepID=UPI001ADB6D70|nr:hypothetical protein [Aquabacter sp. L1I39]QTL04831.1 hypothetical protein J5J86_05800 [Aquabacter sp. L1I39]